MSLGDADRICVTTFAEDGTATTSSEFVVRLGEDTVGVWTPHSTPWVDRLAHSHVVSVQAASGSGKALRTEPVFEGRANLVTEGDQLAEAAASTRAKYGLAAGITRAVDWAWEVTGTKSPDGLVVIHIVG